MKDYVLCQPVHLHSAEHHSQCLHLVTAVAGAVRAPAWEPRRRAPSSSPCPNCPALGLPSQVTANDLQENITKLNNGVAFMIKHSQKLFKVQAPGPCSPCCSLLPTVQSVHPPAGAFFCCFPAVTGGGSLAQTPTQPQPRTQQCPAKTWPFCLGPGQAPCGLTSPSAGQLGIGASRLWDAPRSHFVGHAVRGPAAGEPGGLEGRSLQGELPVELFPAKHQEVLDQPGRESAVT